MLLPSPTQATLSAADPAETLLHGHEVAEHLAGMVGVGQAVDHRDGGVPGQFLHRVLGEGADHHPVHVAGQDPGGVADGLAAGQLGLARGQVDGWPPSCAMPASKETRVRVEGLSKIMASVFPARSRCSIPFFCFSLRSRVKRKMPSSSAFVNWLSARKSFFIQTLVICAGSIRSIGSIG